MIIQAGRGDVQPEWSNTCYFHAPIKIRDGVKIP